MRLESDEPLVRVLFWLDRRLAFDSLLLGHSSEIVASDSIPRAGTTLSFEMIVDLAAAKRFLLRPRERPHTR
jgi:hypothetical protein